MKKTILTLILCLGMLSSVFATQSKAPSMTPSYHAKNWLYWKWDFGSAGRTVIGTDTMTFYCDSAGSRVCNYGGPSGVTGNAMGPRAIVNSNVDVSLPDSSICRLETQSVDGGTGNMVLQHYGSMNGSLFNTTSGAYTDANISTRKFFYSRTAFAPGDFWKTRLITPSGDSVKIFGLECWYFHK